MSSDLALPIKQYSVEFATSTYCERAPRPDPTHARCYSRLRTMWYVYADTRISQMKPKSALDTERRYGLHVKMRQALCISFRCAVCCLPDAVCFVVPFRPIGFYVTLNSKMYPLSRRQMRIPLPEPRKRKSQMIE